MSTQDERVEFMAKKYLIDGEYPDDWPSSACEAVDLLDEKYMQMITKYKQLQTDVDELSTCGIDYVGEKDYAEICKLNLLGMDPT